MNIGHGKSFRRKRKAGLRCFCIVPLISVVICGAVLGNIIFVEHKANPPQDISFANDEQSSIETKADNTQTQINTSGTSEWALLLVNPWNKLPEDFSVELTTLKNGHSIDKRAYPDLQAMMDDAGAEGLSPIICSSFRTREKQENLFDNQVRKYISRGYSQESAMTEAAKWVALPGTSEHQTGLAVDIVALSYQILDEQQEDTAEQKWLMENAYKYGFILRYPADKTEITGIGYEPWHYRYVGREAAKEIYESGLCLEEYLNT